MCLCYFVCSQINIQSKKMNKFFITWSPRFKNTRDNKSTVPLWEN